MGAAAMLATIDVGTNTALLLVTEVADGRLIPHYEEERFIRLGEGVDATGLIQPDALERLRKTLLDYKAIAASLGAQTIVVAGTSASRDARNRDALVDFVRRETGLTYEILSGEDEAHWTFVGAVSAFGDLRGPCVVIDIGGGSTEVVASTPAPGDATREATPFRQSFDVGAVRLAERFFAAQPPPAEAVARAEAFTLSLFESAGFDFPADATLIGTSGTASALVLVDRGVSQWSDLGEAAPGLSAAAVRSWRERLLEMTFSDVLALNPAVMQGRADVFPAGILILDLFMRYTGLDVCRVSPRGLRHGLALRHYAAG